METHKQFIYLQKCAENMRIQNAGQYIGEKKS